ncbi:hypothetical protein JHK82_052342 [Glycine max]|uniref:Uncharacterized protein n=1 Tax=Glycine soja TaxID=3848 RepID=A0A0B2PA03_GLYSO|nr:hypothetical protein JHK85_053029 [Glycine max]KAG5082180.1 hypothetical protein JHK84_052218 [Glycine max]KAG5084945.1 hypothetical protein JHK82_052342 [Glycine max]KHN04389.1 hypothetical protein glysoja_038031 [Glycine soja]
MMENLIYFSLISLCYCLLFYIHKSGTGSLFITILLLLVLLYVIFNVFSSYFCCGCIVIVPSVYQMWIRIIPCEMGNNNILLPEVISGILFSVGFIVFNLYSQFINISIPSVFSA